MESEGMTEKKKISGLTWFCFGFVAAAVFILSLVDPPGVVKERIVVALRENGYVDITPTRRIVGYLQKRVTTQTWEKE